MNNTPTTELHPSPPLWMHDRAPAPRPAQSLLARWLGRAIGVMPREHYRLHQRDYPIAQVAALEKVLRLAAGSDHLLHQIGPLLEGRRSVCSFIAVGGYQPPQRLLLVPECAALAAAHPGQLIDAQQGERRLFAYQAAGRYASALAGLRLATAQDFAFAAGIPAHTPVLTLTGSAVAQAQQQGVMALLRHQPLRFVNRRLFTPALLRRVLGLLLAPLAVGAVYLVALSLWLGVSNARLQATRAELQAEAAPLLAQQRSNEQTRALTVALQQQLAQVPDLTSIWQVVSLAAKQGAIIEQIRWDDGRVRLRGRTLQTTALLTALSADPRVQAAKIDSPTRLINTEESFDISLRVVAPARTAAPAAPAAAAPAKGAP